MSYATVASEDHEQALVPLLRRLGRITSLSPEAIDVLDGLPLTVRTLPARTVVHLAEQRPAALCFLTEGIAAKFTLMRSGEMPISAIQIPGDFPGLLLLLLPTSDFSLQTITACRMAFVDRAILRDRIMDSPELTEVFWSETLRDGAVFRMSALRIGQLPAVSRVAHFLCEMKSRLEAVQATRGDSFSLDLTQQDLGDALALSFVSVNRALRELRKLQLVAVERPRVDILRWKELTQVAQFNPTYLHLPPGSANREAQAPSR